MRAMTVCFLIKNVSEKEILLGFKKIGFGAGKYAGIGGKVESGESVEQAAVREVEEEIGVHVLREDLQYKGTVTFVFLAKPQWNGLVSIFLTERWAGEPGESDEMRPEWFKPGDIPYHTMWQDAPHWLPQVINGDKIFATITFREDNETVEDVAFFPKGEKTEYSLR